MLKYYIKKIFSFLPILLILSCTNRFVVGENIATELSSVNVSVSGESISNYEFENHLYNILNSKSGALKYKLEVSLQTTSASLVIQKDADSARESVELFVKYSLYNANGSELLYSGKFRRLASYNTLFSPYSTNVEQIQTDKNLAKSSAEELRRRLILYFKRTGLT